MKAIKIDKRIKYNNVFTLWSALDSKYNYDFSVLETVQNTVTKQKYLVLRFTKGYKQVNVETLENICTLLQTSYPKSEFKIRVRQYRYAPEQKEDVLFALCK